MQSFYHLIFDMKIFAYKTLQTLSQKVMIKSYKLILEYIL